jgi:LysM repeat protein
MTRRSLLGFIILNVLVTFVTVFGIISIWTRIAPQSTRAAPSSPLVVVVTATLDPKSTQVAYIVVTATPQQGSGGSPAIQPTPGAAEGTATALVGLGTVPTLDPSLLPILGTVTPTSAGNSAANLSTPGAVPNVTGSPAANATDQNGCPTYTIKKGDTAGNIADTYGISLADLMRANKLTERDLSRLQIGQVLTIPVNGCGLATEEPSQTPTRFVIPTLPPTVTFASTASSSQIEIVQVVSPGDITSEGVEIRNVSGGVIQMQGWKLTDSKDKTFNFPESRIFPGGRVTIFTKDGKNTPIVLYWGLSRAVWTDPNQEIQIIDAKGNIQARRTVSGAPLPGGGAEQPTVSGDFIPTQTQAP